MGSGLSTQQQTLRSLFVMEQECLERRVEDDDKHFQDVKLYKLLPDIFLAYDKNGASRT